MERLTMPPIPTTVQERLEVAGISNLTCEELARMQVDQINNTSGKLIGIDCPDCKNRGYFAKLDAQFRRYSVECKCMAHRRSLERIERSGMSDMLERYTMDAWQEPEPWQARAKELAIQYAENPDGKWFCMAGSVGTGKSHLCAALTGLLMSKGVDAIYMLWRDVAVRAKAVAKDGYEYSKIVEPLKHVRLLYIDDLFKVGKSAIPTEADVSLAFEILNYRYNDKNLLTIISSERTVDELLDIDEAVGSRVYERSRGYYLPLVDLKNWRLK